MPRNGDGSSHNGPFDAAGHHIAHGVGDAGVRPLSLPSALPPLFQSSEGELADPTPRALQTSRVARADKTAPLPEAEKGLGVEGLGASGGRSQGVKQGPHVGQGGGSSN